jgi:hypothetical protein
MTPLPSPPPHRSGFCRGCEHRPACSDHSLAVHTPWRSVGARMALTSRTHDRALTPWATWRTFSAANCSICCWAESSDGTAHVRRWPRAVMGFMVTDCRWNEGRGRGGGERVRAGVHGTGVTSETAKVVQVVGATTPCACALRATVAPLAHARHARANAHAWRHTGGGGGRARGGVGPSHPPTSHPRTGRSRR